MRFKYNVKIWVFTAFYEMLLLKDILLQVIRSKIILPTHQTLLEQIRGAIMTSRNNTTPINPFCLQLRDVCQLVPSVGGNTIHCLGLARFSDFTTRCGSTRTNILSRDKAWTRRRKYPSKLNVFLTGFSLTATESESWPLWSGLGLVGPYWQDGHNH